MRLPKALAVCVGVLLAASGAAAGLQATSRQPSARAAHVALSGTGRYALTANASTADPTSLGGTSAASPSSGGASSKGLALGRTASSNRLTDLPTPSLTALPPVAPLRDTRSVDAIVLMRSPLTSAQAAKLVHLAGLAALEVVDTGTVQMGRAPVVTFGVDPGSFRAFTPAASASSDRLWQYLAAGSLVSSYEMATDRRLHLGAEEGITSARQPQPIRGWMGAFASIGLPGVDLLVDHSYSSNLGLAPNTGLVISAPAIAGHQLLTEVQGALPGAAVELMHPDQVTTVVNGNGLTDTQRATLVSSALSRVGLPYVWGATGPSSFDCSGLVQWSYAKAGVLMPRTAAEQFLTGAQVPLAAAQPGDLLAWHYDPNDPSFVDHIAIYIGNGMMVVAPHAGLNVQVEPVPTNNLAGVVQVVLRRG